MNHDAAHKYIYGLPEVAADLLRIVARDWVGELDLATLEDRSSEFLDDRHRKRIGDMVFSARLLRGRLLNGRRPHLLGRRPASRPTGRRCLRPGWSGPWPRFSRRRTICSLPAVP